METLGSLCDKLTVVQLKLWHTEDGGRRESLLEQAGALRGEIDDYVAAVIRGDVSLAKLQFPANKVAAVPTPSVGGGLGDLVSQLARVNTDLWHEMERAYAFEKVPPEEKNQVVRRLAELNLERNACIDEIDRRLVKLLGENPCT